LYNSHPDRIDFLLVDLFHTAPASCSHNVFPSSFSVLILMHVFLFPYFLNCFVLFLFFLFFLFVICFDSILTHILAAFSWPLNNELFFSLIYLGRIF